MTTAAVSWSGPRWARLVAAGGRGQPSPRTADRINWSASAIPAAWPAEERLATVVLQLALVLCICWCRAVRERGGGVTVVITAKLAVTRPLLCIVKCLSFLQSPQSIKVGQVKNKYGVLLSATRDKRSLS